MIVPYLKRRKIMVRKLVAATMLAGALTISACATVRGAASDVTSAANCTENTMKTGYCK
jgi:predicted small secreted protein